MRIVLAALIFAISISTAAQTVPVPDMVIATQPGRPKGPLPLACSEEPYPQAAMASGAVGKTILTFSIDADGYLEHALVLQRAGQSGEHKLLDAAAARYLWSCRFARPERPNTLIQATFVWKSSPGVSNSAGK